MALSRTLSLPVVKYEPSERCPPNSSENYATRYYKVVENSSEVYDIVTRSLNRKRNA